jgi:hypothetical protein
LKRLLNEDETGLSRPNSWRMVMMMMQKPKSGLGRFIVDVSRSQIHPARPLWRSDQLVAEAATYTTHNKYETPTTIPSTGFEFLIAARAATDIRLRKYGHRDDPASPFTYLKCYQWFNFDERLLQSYLFFLGLFREAKEMREWLLNSSFKRMCTKRSCRTLKSYSVICLGKLRVTSIACTDTRP